MELNALRYIDVVSVHQSAPEDKFSQISEVLLLTFKVSEEGANC